LALCFTDTFHIESAVRGLPICSRPAYWIRSSSWSLLLQARAETFDLRIKIDDIDLEDLRTLARIARLVDANRESDPRPGTFDSYRSAAD